MDFVFAFCMWTLEKHSDQPRERRSQPGARLEALAGPIEARAMPVRLSAQWAAASLEMCQGRSNAASRRHVREENYAN